MKTKDIQICGTTVTLGYCYATEISFKILSGEDIQPFILESIQMISESKFPDTEKAIFLILAAAMAYSESHEQEPPIDAKTIMYEASPTEVGTALGTVIALWTDFYHIPAGEPKDKEQKGHKRKN